MAKFQTRRSVSLSSELFNRARAYASNHGDIPLAQMVAQALEALLSGAVQLGPRTDSHPAHNLPREGGRFVSTQPAADRGTLDEIAARRLGRPSASAPRPPVGRACAVCTDPIGERAIREPFGKGGALVCHRESEDEVKDQFELISGREWLEHERAEQLRRDMQRWIREAQVERQRENHDPGDEDGAR